MIKAEDSRTNSKPMDKDVINSLFFTKDGVLYFKERGRDLFKTDSAFKRWNSIFSNKPCGCFSGGYLKTKTMGFNFLNHRVIYFIETGVNPKIIDHIDGNTLNNKISNLRNVDKAKNGVNCKLSKKNSTGRKGVYFHKSLRKWTASVVVNGKLKHLGVFEDFESASVARCDAEYKYYGEYSREQAIKYFMEN